MKVNQATHSVGDDVPIAEDFEKRVLRVAGAADVRPGSLGSGADGQDRGDPPRARNGVYGSPNIHAELADDYGIRVGRKRVARLMRAAGLRGATLRRYVVTTQRGSEG